MFVLSLKMHWPCKIIRLKESYISISCLCEYSPGSSQYLRQSMAEEQLKINFLVCLDDLWDVIVSYPACKTV